MNFTAPRYVILFLNFEIYIVHVINHEWNRSMCFVWDTKPGLLTSSCIYIFFWLIMYFVLVELSMIGGDIVMCLFLFLVSHYATLIIVLYLWGYSWYMSCSLCYVKSRIYFVLLVFSTYAFMCLLSVTGIYRLIQSYCCLQLQLIYSS